MRPEPAAVPAPRRVTHPARLPRCPLAVRRRSRDPARHLLRSGHRAGSRPVPAAAEQAAAAAGAQFLAGVPQPTALRTGDDRQESGRTEDFPSRRPDVAYGPQRLNAIIGAYEDFLDRFRGTDDFSFHLKLELPAAETPPASRAELDDLAGSASRPVNDRPAPSRRSGTGHVRQRVTIGDLARPPLDDPDPPI